MLHKLWDYLTGRTWARNTIREFMLYFPGKCPICSFHRHAIEFGIHSPGSPVDRHPRCPEGTPP